jgi:hypothetical protein
MRTRDARAMGARRRRVARGAGATGVGVLLAAVSHTYGGGDAPGAGLVLAAALLTWPIAALLAAPRLRLAGVAAGAVLSQLALHVAFALTAGSTAIPPGTKPAAASHHHTGAALDAATLLSTTSGTHPGMLLLPDGGMLASHAAAALVAFVVLGFGGRVLRAVAAGIRTAARRASAPLRPVASRAVAAASGHRIRVAREPWSRTLLRRGPPILSVSF